MAATVAHEIKNPLSAIKSIAQVMREDEHLRNGLNVYEGMVTHRAVAEALKLKFTPPQAALRL